jgi:hypothetical protein
VLLASGWWGIARHFHYVTEVLTSFFWALPALDGHVFPYMYAIYLTFLLLDRLLREMPKEIRQILVSILQRSTLQGYTLRLLKNK